MNRQRATPAPRNKSLHQRTINGKVRRCGIAPNGKSGAYNKKKEGQTCDFFSDLKGKMPVAECACAPIDEVCGASAAVLRQIGATGRCVRPVWFLVLDPEHVTDFVSVDLFGCLRLCCQLNFKFFSRRGYAAARILSLGRKELLDSAVRKKS